jgi:hypothetical protein
MTEQTNVEEIWVSTTEAAEMTGYNSLYLQKLARKMWRQSEAERVIKTRYRSRRYQLWLPDLINYIHNLGNGPRKSPGEIA